MIEDVFRPFPKAVSGTGRRSNAEPLAPGEVVAAVASFAVNQVLAYRIQTAIEAMATQRCVFVQTGFVRIEPVNLAPTHIRDIGHKHIRTREHAALASVVRQRLQRRRCGDVHVVQIKARDGDHAKA